MTKVLKDKMYDYEVSPPSRTWSNIASALDTADLDAQYPVTLRDLSVIPPVSAWQKIADSLPAQPAVITPVRTISPWFKYAAAAVILAFLAWGAFSLFNTDQPADDIASGDTDLPVPSIESLKVPETETSRNSEQVVAERDDAALEASKKTYARLSGAGKSRINEAANFYFSAPEYEYYDNVQTRGLDISDSDPAPHNSIDESNRYIMLMTPDGHIIRISKKLSNLVCCVAGEEEDIDCTDRMKELREKIANPSTTQSPADFMDILSLVRSL